MTPIDIKGHTHRLGAPADWNEERDGPCGSLAVRVTGSLCQSAWKPTAEDVALLSAGGVLILSVFGRMSPVMLHVEEKERPTCTDVA